MESWVNDCRYLLMPARHPVPSYEKEYTAAYSIWREAWEKYRREAGITGNLYSDGFALPDEMGVLFYQDSCVGLSSFTYGHLDQGPMPDFSWFGSWDQLSYQRLKAISHNAMICSQFTVNPKFAGKGHIVRWKEIIFLYTFMRFEHSKADVMAGCLNLTRGMQNACGESFGATVLRPEHTFSYGGIEIPAQLVAYERENIKNMKIQRGIVELCDQLWERLVHLSEFPVVGQVIKQNKAA